MLTGKARACCPTCGPIEVAAAEITILPCPDTSTNLYRCRCPRCGSAIVKDAGPAVVTLLLRASANVDRWQEPSNDQALSIGDWFELDIADGRATIEANATSPPRARSNHGSPSSTGTPSTSTSAR